MHISPFFALALVPLFAFADRIVGSGKPSRSTGMALAAFGGGAIIYLTSALPLAFAGLLWAAHRSMPFSGGAGAPQNSEQKTATVVREVLILPIALLAYFAGRSVVLLAILLAIVVIVAIVLRFDYGDMVKKATAAGTPLTSDFNATLEKITGAMFGIAMAAFIIITSTALG